MRKLFVLLMVVSMGTVLLGCGSSGGSGEQAATNEAAANDAATNNAASDHAEEAMTAEAVSMEVACAGCIYHMAGVTTCTPAVKVGETPMLLTGVPVDAHALGLCEAPKTAMVAGKVDGDRFVATMVELE